MKKDGEYKNYGRKERIIAQGLELAENFPQDWDREKMWNEVERAEKNKNAQLFRRWDMALPKELSQKENIKLAEDFVKKYFVAEGMCADWAIHIDSENNNPHLHIMTTVRAMDENQNWMPKKRKEYILKNGKKQYDKKTKTYKCKTIATNDWHTKDFLMKIRKAWAREQNAALRKAGRKERVTEKSYKELGAKNQIYKYLRPTKHRGQTAKYDNVDEMAHNEKIIRTYMRDALRTYYRIKNPDVRKKVLDFSKIKVAGFPREKLKSIFAEEEKEIKSQMQKIGRDALRPEINWDLLSEYERQDQAYKNAEREL